MKILKKFPANIEYCKNLRKFWGNPPQLYIEEYLKTGFVLLLHILHKLSQMTPKRESEESLILPSDLINCPMSDWIYSRGTKRWPTSFHDRNFLPDAAEPNHWPLIRADKNRMSDFFFQFWSMGHFCGSCPTYPKISIFIINFNLTARSVHVEYVHGFLSSVKSFFSCPFFS